MQIDTFALGELKVKATDDAGTTDNGGPAEAVVGGAFFGDDVVGFVFDEIGDVSADGFIEKLGDGLAAEIS